MNKVIDIKYNPCGAYETNCYIVCFENVDIIIDPGMNALQWLKEEVDNPIAILNTHGHFDHIWDNTITKEFYNIPLYVPKDDVFMLQDTTGINNNVPVSTPDIQIDTDKEFVLNKNIQIQYIHLPGHTPGTCIIVIDDYIFSGDFVFNDSIGRVDFPYSSAKDMKESINKFISLDLSDKTILPGHGRATSLYKEQDNIKKWLEII
jgi:glyoxylase-like metal-dependent hydrolase (beta-lactamase superfamily II)